MHYSYFINLDERGGFNADVRDEAGQTVFEVKAGDELPNGETSVFEDGYMKGPFDLAGLGVYLSDVGIMKPGDTLSKGN